MGTGEIKNRRSTEKAIKSNKVNESSSPAENERLQRARDKKPDEYCENDPHQFCDKNDEKHLNNGELLNNSNVKRTDYETDDEYDSDKGENKRQSFVINIQFDLVTFLLFGVAFCTRVYKLATPNNVVFDELHYGKYVSMYMKNIFFFDQHPPLGKQLIAGVAHLSGYDGNFTFSRIGAQYSSNVPIFWLRFVPALCGSLLPSAVYKLLLEMQLHRLTALLGGILIIFDNSMLTQSRFILMESMLLLFSTAGLLFLLRFQKSNFISIRWIWNGLLSAMFLTFAISIKYVGIYSYILSTLIMCRFLWRLLAQNTISDFQIIIQTLCRWLIFTPVPIVFYLIIFGIHLNILHKAGPHDSVMTSAFQASLDGGLASITKGQPLSVVHGSQITLRHTYGRTCWMHSHLHLYPVRYPDNRGSSHQQQVSCYSFKDVNNWWIVKRPDRDDLVVGEEPEPIKHGDQIQLVHGITSRALNSHDVAAPVTPTSQEVSCYIDYNVSMPGQLLWQLDIINKDDVGDIWHAIRSEIRLIHVTTGFALRFSGRQLPEWGFNQHEIVADRTIEQKDNVWNVEEHRYTKTEDQKERERQMLNAEMIPTKRTYLSFWDKFVELQTKMLWHADQLQNHMYSSEPLEWPLMSKGIAYWVDKNSNAQIHLLGNIIIWYSGSLGIVTYLGFLAFYLIRRRRLCYDLSTKDWKKFQAAGEIFLGGYFIHYLPHFFIERTTFLHNYLPAFLFKILLLCFVIEHIYTILKTLVRSSVLLMLYKLGLVIWISVILLVYKKFLALSYGMVKLSPEDVIALRWKDTWDFILHKNLS